MSGQANENKQWGTVLILLFDGVNTLDVNGPLEVLCNYACRTKALKDGELMGCPFDIVFASEDGAPVQAFEFIRLESCKTFKEAATMITEGKVDALITPGYAPPATGDALIKNDKSGIWNVFSTFLNQSPRHDGRPRWMISICVGAILMNNAHCFDGRYATTHFMALQSLMQHKSSKVKWVRKRWVDGGMTQNQIRIVSSGGIACGIDCMLWFVKEVLGLDSALAIANMMDYVYDRALLGDPATEQD